MYLKMKKISCLIDNKYIIWAKFVFGFFFGFFLNINVTRIK